MSDQQKKQNDNVQNMEERHWEQLDLFKKNMDAVQSDLNSTREKLLAAKREIEILKQSDQNKEQVS